MGLKDRLLRKDRRRSENIQDIRDPVARAKHEVRLTNQRKPGYAANIDAIQDIFEAAKTQNIRYTKKQLATEIVREQAAPDNWDIRKQRQDKNLRETRAVQDVRDEYNRYMKNRKLGSQGKSSNQGKYSK